MLLTPLSCGTLIGLDEFKSDEGNDGSSGGGSNDTGGRTGNGGSQSSGGNGDGGTGDGGSLSSGGTPSDGGSSSGGTGGTGGGTPISCGAGEEVLVIDSSATRNGSFEFPASTATKKNAAVWAEFAIDYEEGEDPVPSQLAYNCPCETVNWSGTEGQETADHPSAGSWSTWLGGIADWDDWLSQELTLPTNVSTARVRMHTNIQSKETNTAPESDWLYVRLVDAESNELATFATRTNQDAQFEVGNQAWTNDGIDETIDVSTWAGQTVYFEIRSTNDYGRATDFLLDDVRLTLGCE